MPPRIVGPGPGPPLRGLLPVLSAGALELESTPRRARGPSDARRAHLPLPAKLPVPARVIASGQPPARRGLTRKTAASAGRAPPARGGCHPDRTVGSPDSDGA